MEDFWPDYVISSLRSVILPYNFIFLPSFPSICGFMPLYKLIFKVIWFFNFIFYHFYYTFIYFLSLVNTFILYFLPWVLFILFKIFIPINLPICPFIYIPINIFNPIGNWVENIEREDFIKIKENFDTFIFITP